LRRDRDVNVRRAVAYYFVRNADARGESALAALTRDQDKWVKFYAFTGLAKTKAKSSKTAILRGLSDGRYFIRLAALNAFIAAEYDLYSQRKLAKDISWHVRAAYARGLKADVVAQNLLLNKMLASDKSPSVKTEALKALAKDPAFAPQVLTYLKSSEWQLREAAVQSHVAFPPEKKEELLTQSYADPDKNVRMAALGELAKIPTVSAFQILKTALTSDELTIRGTAVGALSERQEPEIAELAWSTYKNSGDSKWVEIRQEIVGLMAKQSTSQSLKNLRQAAKDPDPSVSALAIEALVKRGEKDLPAPVLGGSLTFTPYRDLTFAANPKIEFETNKGRFLVETYPKEAPVHVANLVGQTKAGLYNGLSWHRVVSNFVVQGGDPDGSGWGDAGYSMRIEVNRVPFERGTLGMPRSSGFDTGGVQLFFDLVPTPHLDGLYTVFGKVVRGEEVLDRLERGDKILKARVLE
jgi:peptidyl-prolyl cis-trans isomerase B (cyclophilin B)